MLGTRFCYNVLPFLGSSMNVLVVLGMAVALAMDCFAVSLGLSCGHNKLSGGQTLRLALHFALFQFAMPVIGWFAGENLLRHIERFDHWIAFGLLTLVGGKMIRESFRAEKDDEECPADRTRGLSIVILSVATSIDALAVGLSLAVLRVNILYPAAIIGIICFALTVAGSKLGPVVGRIAGKRAELGGGLILIAIGIKILVEHL
jgi:putative Mn2+ efflux pump MntP